jgi:hypothetical protein
MECDYMCLNHDSLVSQKKSGHQGRDNKGGLTVLGHCHMRSEIIEIVDGFQHLSFTFSQRFVSLS